MHLSIATVSSNTTVLYTVPVAVNKCRRFKHAFVRVYSKASSVYRTSSSSSAAPFPVGKVFPTYFFCMFRLVARCFLHSYQRGGSQSTVCKCFTALLHECIDRDSGTKSHAGSDCHWTETVMVSYSSSSPLGRPRFRRTKLLAIF